MQFSFIISAIIIIVVVVKLENKFPNFLKMMPFCRILNFLDNAFER